MDSPDSPVSPRAASPARAPSKRKPHEPREGEAEKGRPSLPPPQQKQRRQKQQQKQQQTQQQTQQPGALPQKPQEASGCPLAQLPPPPSLASPAPPAPASLPVPPARPPSAVLSAPVAPPGPPKAPLLVDMQSPSMASVDALQAAQSRRNLRVDQKGRQQCVFFADASRHVSSLGPRPRELGGYAVVYRPPGQTAGPHLARAWDVPRLPHIDHGEMLGIAEGLNIALEHGERGALRNATVLVFTDSKFSLGAIAASPRHADAELQDIVEFVVWAACRLRLWGCSVELRWMPGHGHGVVPHQVADELSRVTTYTTEPFI
ncbi:hypothetical protein B0T24DRAFT_591075 [Lasiosphaeria ovina]|uniref:RNase H type-1 domain-containing protein n=1 Tax=Lasiosphaeria ovina TaxID=92902 RepID=A0AAE0NFR7_9PEZI|nr:hypothetical protein B0T24DRAFT_591075 [Lasiosphaeria ovina]